MNPQAPIEQLVDEVYESATPAMKNQMLAQLVGQVYETAPNTERKRLVEHLMKPLGILSLAAVANIQVAQIAPKGRKESGAFNNGSGYCKISSTLRRLREHHLPTSPTSHRHRSSRRQLPPKSQAIIIVQAALSSTCHGSGAGAPVKVNSMGKGTEKVLERLAKKAFTPSA